MDLLNTLKDNGKMCTGCGACNNICPVGAISMKPDKYGFLYPEIDNSMCIDCGKCEKTCPKLGYQNTNNENPSCFAVMADDETRMNSSSGGVFTVVARWILDHDGVVCGATMGEDYYVKHICIQKHEDLPKLQKSKYVQSDIGYVYREMETYLKKGRYVLFTGCPCQVAAVKKIFKDKYERLFCADILCHGVPSPQMWQDYLKENFNLQDVEKIEFRNKKNGWRCDQLYVKYVDGSERFIPRPESAFADGFLSNITLRESCAECEFCNVQRTGDISMGDFWGIANYEPSLHSPKGTSGLLINNAKGKALIDAVKAEFSTFTEMPLENFANHNRTKPRCPRNRNIQRFLQMYPQESFTKAVFQTKRGLYDIGLVGTHLFTNYGSQLVQWALYKVLTDMGYSTLMIERPKNARSPRKSKEPKLFQNNPYPPYAIAEEYNSITDMKRLNNNCDIFVTGSDQIFNHNGYIGYNRFMVQNFVSDNKPKIAYAASWGHAHIWGSEYDRAEQAYFMQKFDYFSVREDSAVDLCRNEYGMQDVTWVLDPVLLCKQADYDKLIDAATVEIPKEKYLFSYLIKPSDEIIETIEAYAQAHGLKIVSAVDAGSRWKSAVKSIEELMAYIKHSELVVTDSFHGTCLSIIFNKQFSLIVKKLTGPQRFYSILNACGISQDIITYNCQDLEKRLNNPVYIDYSVINPIMDREIVRCKQWLQNAIESSRKIKKPLSAYDILDNRIDRVLNFTAARRKRLLDRIEALEQKYSHMLSQDFNSSSGEVQKPEDADSTQAISVRIGTQFSEEVSFPDYLTILQADKEKYVVLIAVKDTPGFLFIPEYAEKMRQLGLKGELVDKHWHSYIAVVDGGNVLYEEVGPVDRKQEYSQMILGNKISLVSAGFKAGNMAKIKINEIDFSTNKRGFNFVVIEKKSGSIVDVVNFDTHAKGIPCFRF